MKIEAKKMKGSHSLLFYVFVLIFTFFLLSVSLFSKGFIDGDLACYRLFDAYFFTKLIISPIFFAALIGRSVDMENRGEMWKVLYSSGIDFRSLYRAKFLYTFKGVLIFQALEWVLIIGYTKALGLNQFLPLDRGLYLFLGQALISFCLLSIHYLLSLKWSNQLISTSVSIVGTLTGVIFMLLSKFLSMVNPYAWFANLFSISYIREGKEFVKVLNPKNYRILVLALIVGLILTILGPKIRGEE